MDLEKPHQAKPAAAPGKTFQISLFSLGMLSGLLYFYNFRLQPLFLRSGLPGKSGIHFYVFLFLALSLLYLIGIYLIFRHRAKFGNSKRPVDFYLFASGDTVYEGILRQNLDYGMISVKLPDSTSQVTIKFSGWDSPDIYGIDLGQSSGITMDNIALRGSSGLIFTKADFGV